MLLRVSLILGVICGATLLMFQNCSNGVFTASEVSFSSSGPTSSVPASAQASINFKCRNVSQAGVYASQITVGPSDQYECEFFALSTSPKGQNFIAALNKYDPEVAHVLGGSQKVGGWDGPLADGRYSFKAANSTLTGKYLAWVYDQDPSGRVAKELVTIDFVGPSVSPPPPPPPPPVCVANKGEVCKPSPTVDGFSPNLLWPMTGVVGEVDCDGTCKPTACDTANGYKFPHMMVVPRQIGRCYKCMEVPNFTWGGADGLLSCQGEFGENTRWTDDTMETFAEQFMTLSGRGAFPLKCVDNKLVPDTSRNPSCTAHYYFSNSHSQTENHIYYRYAPTYDLNICSQLNAKRCQVAYDQPPDPVRGIWNITCACDTM